MPQGDVINPVGKGIAVLGFALVAGALAILITIFQTVNHIMDDPTQVPVVKFLMEKIGSSDKGIYGNVDGKPYEVNLGEPLRYMLYVVMGAMALGILTRVFSGLMSAGVAMIRMGSSMQGPPPPDSGNRPPM
jgi:hypothetical protein